MTTPIPHRVSANVRQEGALGSFKWLDFVLEIDPASGPDARDGQAIEQLRIKGFETRSVNILGARS